MNDKPPVRQDALETGTAVDVDEEVQAQLETREQRQREERRKRRPKATYDLPLGLIEAVKQIASEESVAQSDVAAWALAEFVERYRGGVVDWTEHKQPARSLRVDWKLELPESWR